MDLSKFKADSLKLGMSEAAVYLLKRLQSAIDDANDNISKLYQHFCVSCGCVTTIGGSATEEFAIDGIKPGQHLLVQMKQVGASPVSIISAKPELGKIVVTFSGNPGADHEITYHVCK